MSANGGEILVFLRILRVFRLELNRAPEMLDCGVGLAGKRLQAGEVVEEARVVGMLLQPTFDHGAGSGVVAASPRRNRVGDRLPRRDFSLARRAAHGERRRVRFRGHRAPASGRIADEDDRPGRRVELLSGDGEACPAPDHDVQLLVVAGARSELVVLLDQLVTWALGPVGVDPERRHAERTPQRLPLELAERRQRLDLVEPDD